MAAPAAFADVCAAMPGVDAVVPLARSRLRRARRARRGAAGGRFDLAILFTNSFASALAASRAGIAERWGYRRDLRGRLLTRAVTPRRGAVVPPGRAGPGRPHHSAYYLRLVAALGMTPVDAAAGPVAALTPSAAAVEQAAALLADAGVDAEAAWSASRPARRMARPSAGRRSASPAPSPA